jgi:hypothetical protein
MYKEKLIDISNKLKRDKVLYFRLYNVLYMITFSNNLFSIKQSGFDLIHTYSSLKELFSSYYVYGSNLMESINDLKLY